MNLKEQLCKLGLTQLEVEVFLILTTSGWITALQLSRKCPIKRTTLYRILENLLAMGLIEKELGDKTTLFTAKAGDNLENLIRVREMDIKQMREMLPDIQEQLGLIRETKSLSVSVRFYRGVRGLQYLELKHTHLKNSEVLIIDSNQWDKALSRAFAEDVRARYVQNKIKVREITNIEDTNTSWTDNVEYLRNYFKSQMISPDILKISQDIYIFGEEINLVGFNQNELVGIEILSPEYAQMMRQMFEILWKIAKKIKI